MTFEEKLAAWEERAEQRNRDRPGHYIERARVAPLVEAWLEDYRAKNDVLHGANVCWGKNTKTQRVQSMGAMEALSFITGITTRQLAQIRGVGEPRLRPKGPSRTPTIEGPGKYLTLDIVDRLFCGMECVHLFHVPAEEGGFADVYLHESVVGIAA